MNVIIPIADEPSQYDDLELEYAIKSWRKFTDVDKIYLIGKKRPVEADVIWIEQHDRWEPRALRHENVRLKLLKACELFDEPFIYSNDDIFVLEPLKSDTLPLYHIGSCKVFGETKGGHYKDMLTNNEGNCFELHVPMPIEPDVYIEASEEGKLNRTPYAQASNLPKERLHRDVKFTGSGWNWHKKQPFLSVGDSYFGGKVRSFVIDRASQ